VSTVIAAALAIGIVVWSGGGGDHRLRAAFQSALNVVPGNEVRIAGRKVGEVRSVEEVDGQAVLELEISDGDHWPLRRGTTARIRWGSLTSGAARYVELHPARGQAPALPDGGILTTADTVTPVEFDEFFRIYDRRTRRNLQRVVRNVAETVDGRAGELGSGLAQGSGGLQRLADLMGELGSDRHALQTLVVAGARTSGALRSREGDLRALLDHAASTFDELAGHARAQQATLERFPAALRTSRDTLGRLDRSLVGMQGLVDDLQPGAAELRRVASPVRRTTAAMLDVSPLATRTLEAGAGAAPDIDRFLRAGTPFMPRLGTVLAGLAPMVGCLRPYGPEIAGQLTDWASFHGNHDGTSHLTRVVSQVPPFGPGTKLNSEQIVNEVFRGKVFYAMPRPPGLAAGKPWFIPECGAGPDALDPSKDPEIRRGGG
jgi:phospholipid/cholesterol/gamma-HCH transport system substrate-binding protein